MRRSATMVTEINMSTELPIPREVLWRARSSVPFMSFLVRDGALNRMDATAETSVEGGSVTARKRTQTYVPKTIEVPDVVKSLIDDTYLEVTDAQQWDDVSAPYEQSFSISPGVLCEYVRMSGVLRLMPSPSGNPNACVQLIVGTCAVDIPFVGYYVEATIVEQMSAFYDTYPSHIANFVADVVTRFGNSSPDSLPAAFDTMLAEEAGSNKKLATPTPAESYIDAKERPPGVLNAAAVPDRDTAAKIETVNGVLGSSANNMANDLAR